MGLLDGLELPERFREIDVETEVRRSQLDELLLFIAKINEPTVLEQGGMERLLEIGQLKYVAPSGESRPFLELDEVAALQVRRGTLTGGERVEIAGGLPRPLAAAKPH